MAFIESLKEAIVQKPLNLKAPHFYKVDNDSKNQLEHLKQILKTAPNNIKPQIERDIKMLSYGIAGEKMVAFELSSCNMPIIILTDLHLEYDGSTAQIDYLIITTKLILVLECKNLFGDIVVNSNGDFKRIVEYNGKRKEEGMYNPIAQNNRHLDMIKKIGLANRSNPLKRAMYEKLFDSFNKSLIVFTNPKAVNNIKYAKKSVKEQIVRCDQLIEQIKKLMQNNKDMAFTEKEMYGWADLLLGYHTPNKVDYTKKYFVEVVEEITETIVKPQIAEIQAKEEKDKNCLEDTQLYKALKQYRYDVSKSEGVKAYFIFNNAQMEEIIDSMPRNLDDIKGLRGFGEIKSQKYGKAILEIIRQNS